MRTLLKKPFFFSSVIFAVLLIGFILINNVFGWTNPSQNPPLGGGILYYFNSKLGIGTSTPPYLVSISSSTDSLLGLFRQGGTIPTIFRQGTDNAFVINSNNSDIVKIKGGNVGIGTAGDPAAKLEVAGQIKITGGSPANGKVLVSDASGLASWQASSTGAGSLPAGASGQTLRHDGTNWVANSVIYNNGTNVGIGTAAPSRHLEVAGSGIQRIGVNSSDTQAGIGFFSDNSGEVVLYSPDGTDDLAMYVGDATRFYVTNSGNVGIGTTSPGAKLHVAYDTIAATDILAKFENINTGQSRIALLRSGDAGTAPTRGLVFFTAGSASGLADYEVRPITFYTSAVAGSASEKMRITTGGNVGIGTAGPNQTLTLTSGALCLSDNSSGDCGTGNQAGDLMFGNSSGGNGSQFEYFNGKLYIGTLASAWHMIIQDNGNVGIGTESPGTYKLYVNGNQYIAGNLALSGTVDGYDISNYGQYFIDSAGSSGQVWKSDGSGKGNWGTDNTGSGVTGSGTSNYIPIWTGASSLGNSDLQYGCIGGFSPCTYGYWTPSYFLGGGKGLCIGSDCRTSWPGASDVSLKQNIQIIPNALEKVLQLNGVSFEWKNNSQKGIGLVAQDVEKVFPEVVSTNQTTGLKSLEYGNLAGPLVEAIKEQQKQIEELKVEVNLLKK